MFESDTWAAVPFHFWSLAFFVFGAMTGSFLNVCIHRMPRGESLVSPPSHCPHCHYSIPWYLNMPLVTWLWLRGKCANCGAPISFRYFAVELLTGLLFLSSWIYFGDPSDRFTSAVLALVYCLFLGGLLAATFIDFEHFIIPDEITLGGVVAGAIGSFIAPGLHGAENPAQAMQQSFIGIVVGAAIVYGLLRLGKLMFGKQEYHLPPDTKVRFTETALLLPEKEIPYEELFYRKSDVVVLQAKTVELTDRCYLNVPIRLTPQQLQIGEDRYNPEEVPHMEVVTDHIVVPREAMGLGDVKFMAAIGAFLGWHGVIFSLMISAMIGALVGVTLIAMGRQDWSSRLPYGPFIALASTLWIFGGKTLYFWWLLGGGA